MIAENRMLPSTDWPVNARFQRGDRVRKIKGSQWRGVVVGWYSTNLTPIGYAVESAYEIGSVQIYPEAALKLFDFLTQPEGGETP